MAYEINHEKMGKDYKKVMETLGKYMYRQPDGTFTLSISLQDELEIDHDVFYDLIRSVAHTNYLLKQGVLNPEDIVD